jgi:acid phosphatase
MTGEGAIDSASIVDNHTYLANPGVSMTHIINGAAGTIESHSTLDAGQSPLNITAVLDFQHYGFNKLQVFNATTLKMSFIEGQDGSVGDFVTILKNNSSHSCTASSSATSSTTSSAASSTTSPCTSTTTPA